MSACGASSAESSAEPTFGEPTESAEPTTATTSTPTLTSTPTPTPEPTPVAKTEMDGFDESTNMQVQLGNVTFSVPSYFNEVDADNEYIKVFRHLEETDTGALLDFIYMQDTEDEFGQEDITGSEQENQDLVESFGFDEPVITDSSSAVFADQNGYQFNFTAVNSDGISSNGYGTYENEWRIVKRFDNKEVDEVHTEFFSYDQTELKGIIIGHNANPELIGLLADYLPKHVKVMKTYVGHRAFQIGILPIKAELQLNGSEPPYITDMESYLNQEK